MRKLIPIFLFFALFNTAFGQNSSIKKSNLIGCWKYYPEDGKSYPDISVYRPCNYQSFGSKNSSSRRGRFKMDLRGNGTCRYLKIGATDINTMESGKWSFDSSTNELRIMDLKMNLVRKFNIARAESRLLGIK